MSKKMIVISITFTAFLLLIVLLSVILSYVVNRRLVGRVYDCNTGDAIENADVRLSDRNWGFRDGSLVWDNDYISTAHSSKDGFYAIDYHIGNSLTARKSGYLNAQDFISNEQTRDIGLMPENAVVDKNQTTYQCKLSSECDKSVVKDGVTVFWNSCTDPNYKP